MKIPIMIPITKSIRAQIFIIVFLIAFPAVCIILYTGLQSRKAAINDAEKETQKLADRISAEQQNLVVSTQQLMVSLAQLPVVINQDKARVELILQKLRTLNPMYSNIFIADRNGLVWATAIPTKPPFIISDRRYFKNALASGEFSSGEYIVSRATTKGVINFAYPVKDYKGTVVGVISVGFILDEYRQLVKRMNLPERTSYVLSDHQGIVLSRAINPEPYIGKPYPVDAFKQIQNGPEAFTVIRAGIGGDKRIISNLKLNLPNEQTPYMYITAGIPMDVVLHSANRVLVGNMAFFMSFLTIAIVSAWYFGKKSISDPVRLLENASQQLARGELRNKVSDLVTGGELGSLAKSFDNMVNQLSARELSLLESQEQLRSFVENAPVVIFTLDKNGKFTLSEGKGLETLGQLPGQVVGQSALDVFSESPTVIAGVRRALNGENFNIENIVGDKIFNVWYTPVKTMQGELNGTISVAIDITERKRLEGEQQLLEKQLLHAQKLESLGVLAGGIAHDFNNILTAIIGNADLALMCINPESAAIDNLHSIEKAAARAADLSNQMLAYSGRGKFVISNHDINGILEEMLHILQVSISKKVVLRLNLNKPLPSVESDATQMRQIFMNLVINASEAIGDKGGDITITTGCMDCDKSYLKDVWFDANITDGHYVFIEVTDTGCGMSKETLTKLFDPFFTTKFTGRGLGMAAVQGIVRGHKGAIKVYSELGKGSSFKILLPASSQPTKIFNHISQDDNWRGSGTVLLVDDEETIRGIGTKMLKVLGFNVVTANDGQEAVEVYKARADISFVVLDLTMPHMDGEQCFRELRMSNPDVKVIMSSGFSEVEVTHKFVGKGLAGFIQKPYKLSALKEAIQKL